jgi:large subunit ribosomal protein L30
MAETIRVKLVRSPIGTTERVRQTLKGLGLGKVGSVRTLARTPAVVGMMKRVPHLVSEFPESTVPAGDSVASEVVPGADEGVR